MPHPKPLISIVVPVFNEHAGIEVFNDSLAAQLRKLSDYQFEIIYCNDGSTDSTLDRLRAIAHEDDRVQIISLTRNFGKEIASTAGIRQAQGAAVMTLDADGQHPVELIEQFLARWRQGAKVVVGRRTANQKEGLVKRYGSKLFYRIVNHLSGVKLEAGLTDFRLIDRSVQQEFIGMTEHGRITRGLVNWLGYKQIYIDFKANARLAGGAGYSYRKLTKLAIDGVVSLSISPLYLAAYLGAIVLPLSLLMGLTMVIDALLGDPFGWHATGSAYVIVFMMALIGVVLVSQGIIGIYLSHIHTETQNRPLYVIDPDASVGLHDS